MSNMDEAKPTTPSVEPVESVDQELAALRSQLFALEQQGRAGANWFYWVGALSLVNSAIILFGGGVFFVVGLGVTFIADHVAAEAAQQNPEMAVVAKGLVIGFDLFIAAVVAGFGWLSNKRYSAIFAIGMALYLLDGLLFVMLQSWMSVAFHAYALFHMWNGFAAYRRINRQLQTPLA